MVMSEREETKNCMHKLTTSSGHHDSDSKPNFSLLEPQSSVETGVNGTTGGNVSLGIINGCPFFVVTK